MQKGGAGNGMQTKRDSIAWQSTNLPPTDLFGLQRIVEARKRLEDLERGRVTLHISFD